MSKSIEQYAIGDELWRHVEGCGTFRYLVQGVRQYDDSAQLEVECQTCSHGWKCRLLLAQNDYGRIVHVHMLNEDEDDRQRHWHTNDGLHFWPTKHEAREEGLRKVVARVKDRIAEKVAALEWERKYLAQLEAAIGDDHA